MHDVYDIIKNIEQIYENETAFKVLKDFERVLDELDLYVYNNWEDGELASGPKIERHWVTCEFMWPRKQMPDPMGGKRLLDYDCKVSYEKSFVIKPRKIRKPDDIRPGTKKGKLDKHPVWIVKIMMPKSLLADMYGTYKDRLDIETESAIEAPAPQEEQPADAQAINAVPGQPGQEIPAEGV